MKRCALAACAVFFFWTASAAFAVDCRFSTYGDLMRWGQQTNWAGDWTAQYNACGVPNLPGDLEYAFNNEWHGGNSAHAVYRMSTNSHAPLSDTQRVAKQCAQLQAQIREFEATMAQLDPGDATHRQLRDMMQQGIVANRNAYDSMCR